MKIEPWNLEPADGDPEPKLVAEPRTLEPEDGDPESKDLAQSSLCRPHSAGIMFVPPDKELSPPVLSQSLLSRRLNPISEKADSPGSTQGSWYS